MVTVTRFFERVSLSRQIQVNLDKETPKVGLIIRIRLTRPHCILCVVQSFRGFRQTKFAYSSSILGSSLLTQLSKLPLKIMLNIKVVKIDSKIIISLHKSKTVTHSVCFKFEAFERLFDTCKYF